MGRKLRSRRDLLHPNLQSKVQKKQERMKETRDAHATERQFKEGDTIYLKNFGSGPKLLSRLISRVTGPVLHRCNHCRSGAPTTYRPPRSRYEDKEASVPGTQPSSAVSALANSHSKQPEGSEAVIDTTPQQN